jgi:hypothetical protein
LLFLDAPLSNRRLVTEWTYEIFVT